MPRGSNSAAHGQSAVMTSACHRGGASGRARAAAAAGCRRRAARPRRARMPCRPARTRPSGTRHPPAWSPVTRPSTLVADAPRRVAEDAAGPDDEDDVGERSRALRRVRRTTVPTDGDDRGRCRELLLGRPLLRRGREVGGVGRDGTGIPDHGVGQRHPFALPCLDHAGCRPAHAEVGLDGAGVPQRAHDLAVDRRVLTLRGDDRVDVGRRAADVDDEHVATDDLGEHLDPAQHGIRRGCPAPARRTRGRATAPCRR